VIQLVLHHFAAQRIAVNAQEFRGARLVSIGTIQHALDEAFFKLADRFVEQNSSLHHLGYQAF